MLTTSLKLADKYNYLEERFEKAFTFLRETDLASLPVGRVEVDGDNLFVNVQEYTTMPKEECRFEAHNAYFDIQYVVSGEEYFGYNKREECMEDTEYDQENDLIFLKDPEEAGYILLKSGDLAIVSPEDAHKPRCIAGSAQPVKKLVVKVKI